MTGPFEDERCFEFKQTACQIACDRNATGIEKGLFYAACSNELPNFGSAKVRIVYKNRGPPIDGFAASLMRSTFSAERSLFKCVSQSTGIFRAAMRYCAASPRCLKIRTAASTCASEGVGVSSSG